jgi:hypothetical protein
MARMFCTLREAAAWLRTTEPQLKGMLAEGILPEFRDGENRLLRVSDIRRLAATRPADDAKRPGPPLQRQAENLSPGRNGKLHEVYASEIKLPLSSTTVLSMPARNTKTLKKPSAARQQTTAIGRFTDTKRERCPAHEFQRRLAPTDPCVWPRRRAEKPSVRKGLWTGVMEDRPSAIVALSALVVVVLSAVVAGVYILTELL